MSYINFARVGIHNIPQSWMTRSVDKAVSNNICYIGVHGGNHTGSCTFVDGVVTMCII